MRALLCAPVGAEGGCAEDCPTHVCLGPPDCSEECEPGALQCKSELGPHNLAVKIAKHLAFDVAIDIAVGFAIRVAVDQPKREPEFVTVTVAIGEPVAWRGPIVMNTDAEIGRAYSELRSAMPHTANCDRLPASGPWGEWWPCGSITGTPSSLPMESASIIAPGCFHCDVFVAVL